MGTLTNLIFSPEWNVRISKVFLVSAPYLNKENLFNFQISFLESLAPSTGLCGGVTWFGSRFDLAIFDWLVVTMIELFRHWYSWKKSYRKFYFPLTPENLASQTDLFFGGPRIRRNREFFFTPSAFWVRKNFMAF